MTAGKGVVREMFPLIHQDKENPTRFFQVWLNLPVNINSQNRRLSCTGEAKAEEDEGWRQGGRHRVGGEHKGERTEMKSPPNSWAADPENDVGVIFYSVKPGGKCEIAPAKGGKGTNRFLYFVEVKSGGSSL